MDSPVINGSELLSLAMSMLLIIVVIVALGWMYSRTRFSQSGSADAIRIVASRALGPKERLILVEVGEQTVLVGITPSNMQTLASFDEAIVVQSATPASNGFADRLKAAVSRSQG